MMRELSLVFFRTRASQAHWPADLRLHFPVFCQASHCWSLSVGSSTTGPLFPSCQSLHPLFHPLSLLVLIFQTFFSFGIITVILEWVAADFVCLSFLLFAFFSFQVLSNCTMMSFSSFIFVCIFRVQWVFCASFTKNFHQNKRIVKQIYNLF